MTLRCRCCMAEQVWQGDAWADAHRLQPYSISILQNHAEVSCCKKTSTARDGRKVLQEKMPSLDPLIQVAPEMSNCARSSAKMLPLAHATPVQLQGGMPESHVHPLILEVTASDGCRLGSFHVRWRANLHNGPIQPVYSQTKYWRRTEH